MAASETVPSGPEGLLSVGPSPSPSKNVNIQKYFFRTKQVKLRNIALYETKARYYLVGKEKHRKTYKMIKIDRTSMDLVIHADPTEYNEREFQSMIQMIKEGNGNGGFKLLCEKAYGILGFIRFLSGYFLILITSAIKVGEIGTHYIYNITNTSMHYIPHKDFSTAISSKDSERTKRYKDLFLGMDLSNFYFSYTYDLTHTLQYNFLSSLNSGQTSLEGCDEGYDERFVWNQYLMSPLISAGGSLSAWILPTIHGHYTQTKFSVYGRTFNISVIARRSRHFAGTRYLKRGVNEQGYVANDVETEQIVYEVSTGTLNQCATTSSHFTSYTQIRGSIPLYWGQEHSTLAPKPPIVLQRFDPYFTATIKHCQDLFKRFGSPMVVLNLIKGKEKQPREKILRKVYAKSVHQLNNWLPEQLRLIYVDYDFHDAKSKKRDVLEDMSKIAEASLSKTGFFHCGKKPCLRKKSQNLGGITYEDVGGEKGASITVQTGLVRSNCIDSLDRTNAAQFVIGKVIFGHQLYYLGLTDDPHLAFNDDVVQLLMEMYQEMGNRLAIQYGGSHLAHTMNSYRNKTFANSSRDLFESFKRYYSNSFTDAEKQDCINIFLGNFVPYDEQRCDLWDMDSDYYLHFKRDDAFEEDAERVAVTNKVVEGNALVNGNHALTISSNLAPETPPITKSSRLPGAIVGFSPPPKPKKVTARNTNTLSRKPILLSGTKWWVGPLREFAKTADAPTHFLNYKQNDDSVDYFSRYYRCSKLTQFDKELSLEFNKPVRPAGILETNSGATAVKADDEFYAIYGIKRWFDTQKVSNKATEELKENLSAPKMPFSVEYDEDLSFKVYGIELNTKDSEKELYSKWVGMVEEKQVTRHRASRASMITKNASTSSITRNDVKRSSKDVIEERIKEEWSIQKTDLELYLNYNKDLETMVKTFNVKQSDLSIYYTTTTMSLR